MRQGHPARLIDTAAPSFIQDVRHIDVAFLAIAGQHAEDGKLQGLLEALAVPYTGSGVLASALAMHKPAAKSVVASAGVVVLPHVLIQPAASPAAHAQDVADRLGLPVIVKPCSEGGSIGIRLARSVRELAELIAGAGPGGEEMLVEPFVTGQAVTVGVLDQGGGPGALPALATEPTGGAEFYDFHAKRDPARHRYECPAAVSAGMASKLAAAACDAHQALRCRGYSRSDFVVTATDMWWLEANTLPGLSRTGNLATAAAAAGMEYDKLIAHILGTAEAAGRYRP
jgi:D-alanine-D-alanine ligase